MFGSHPSAKRWAKLGRLRLEQQMVRNVSSEGLHLEHSPYYHFYVFRQFYYAFCMAHAYQFPFSEAYTRKLRTMVEAGAALVKPNRKLAALGDTSSGSPLLLDSTDLKSWCLDDPAPVHSLLTDQKDPCPASSSALYAKSGLATFRHEAPEGSSAATSSYVILRLGTFPTAHIHRDVFSFEFFAFGTDLIVDSGGPYGYGHPLRDQYFLTTKAHNTVVVDDEDQEIGQSEIVSWRSTGDVDFLLAEHRNYIGVTHRRAFIFIKPDVLVIIDKLAGERIHKYSQLFHLAPELNVSLRGESVSTTNSKGGATMKLVPLRTEGVGLQVHRGTERPYQGWVCTSGHKREPAAVIEYSQQRKIATFATLIAAEPQGESREISAAIQGRPLDEDALIEITINSRPLQLLLSADGVLRPNSD
jgi:hypothetical protein